MTTKNTTASFIITGQGKISAVVNGKAYTVTNDNKNYSKILQSLREENWDEFVSLCDTAKTINSYAKDSGIEVKDGTVYYKDQPLHNAMCNKILSFIGEGLPYKPLVNCLDRLMNNTSMRIRNELCYFIDRGDLPITEDGFILGFKKVRGDFKDIYTGTIDNSPGAKMVRMNRSDIDDDGNNTCSYGYHFCSIAYLSQFGAGPGNKVVIVKVDPSDIAAIPTDHNHTKARCCYYEVLSEYTGDWEKSLSDGKNGFDSQLYSSDGGDYITKPNGQKCWAKRDAKGHFVKKNR